MDNWYEATQIFELTIKTIIFDLWEYARPTGNGLYLINFICIINVKGIRMKDYKIRGWGWKSHIGGIVRLSWW